ncbi:PEBP-like protein [Microthyrium microscopicum]|uniref:PEBP-like protein n=1 Tax=Microthyrium microscopicum TaxID=703497 RepID=A0A6A6USS3_9PEZI|nr:PEBP-like protein [Microthyrium microscopicum]
MIAFKSMLCLEALFFVVAAQTPSGFNPSITQPLKVTYGANDISPAGKMIARPETANPPTIGVPQNMISATAKGFVAMVDLDVPRGNQRVTNLHWFAPNVDISKANAVVPTGAGVVSYRQPSPPPGDTPHRYIYLMYAQPGNFTAPPQFAMLQQNRLGFDVNAFATMNGLGQPMAANFIMVQQ